MFGKRCSLCGGKLVNNKCTLCGLDNSKSDANYKVNVSHCDEGPMTHVHEEKPLPGESEEADKKIEDSFKENTPKTKISQTKPAKAKPAKVKPVKTKPVFQTGKSSKSSAKGWIVTIVILALTFGIEGIQEIADSASETFREWTDGEGTGEKDTEFIDYDDSQYEYVTWELSEMGQKFDIELQRGKYIVGVHIPEGTYQVSNLGDYTYLILDDFENMIYIGEEFRGDTKEAGDLRCYTGATVEIDGDGPLYFYSENAQSEQMAGLENPLTESVDVQDGYVAGIDFPAGTYNIVEEQSIDTGVRFSYVVPGTVIEDPDAEYPPVTGSAWIDASEETFVYNNLYFPEGTKILVDEGKTVHLEPSEVLPESYEGYYYMYE